MESQINSEASASTTTSAVVMEPNDNTTEAVGPEMGVDTPMCAPNVGTDVEMGEAGAPSPRPHYPNTPFTLLHVWEDHYTREGPSNWAELHPRGAPDNVVAIPSYLFQEFLSLLASHGPAPVAHSVAPTASAEGPSSNTPDRASSRSAIRSAVRSAPRTILSPILEESPTPSGRALSTITDSMTAVASPAPLRERESEKTTVASPAPLREQESEKTTVQIIADILAESPRAAEVDLQSNKLTNETAGNTIKHNSVASRGEGPTVGPLLQDISFEESSLNTPLRERLGRSARAQRTPLRSEQTQTYDATGNRVFSGGRRVGLLLNLVADNDKYDSDDEGMYLLAARRNMNTRATLRREQATESTEAQSSTSDATVCEPNMGAQSSTSNAIASEPSTGTQSSTGNATASEPSTEAVNDDQGTAAGQAQTPQASFEIGDGQLIAATPAPTTPGRGWNFGSLLTSARSVSRFIPGFAPTPTRPLAVQPVTDNAATTNTPDAGRLALQLPEDTNTPVSRHLALPVAETTAPTTPNLTTQMSRATQTERRRRASATAGPSHGAGTATAPRTFRTKKDVEAQKLGILMRGARRQKAKEDAERKEKLEKAKKAAEQMRKEEEKDTVPGGKRKRSRSSSTSSSINTFRVPDCSTCSESEDDDEDENVATPIQKGKERANNVHDRRRSKRARVTDEQEENEATIEDTPRGRTRYRVDREPSSYEVVGDPHRARPYTGTVCPLPSSNGSLYHGGNVFEQADSAKEAARSRSRSPSINTFRVPDCSTCSEDNDEDEDEEAGEDDTLTGSKTPKSVSKMDVDITTPKTVTKLNVNLDLVFGPPRDATTAARPTISSSAQITKSVTNTDVKTTTPQQEEPYDAATHFGTLIGAPNVVTTAAKPTMSSSPQITKSVTNTDVKTTTPQREEPYDAATYFGTHFGAPKDATTAAKPAITSSPQTLSRKSSFSDRLPTSNDAIDTEALARARSQANKYLPKQPSGLRAQSRLSTSTVASDVGEDADGVLGGPETPAAVQISSQAPAEHQQGDSAVVGSENEVEQQQPMDQQLDVDDEVEPIDQQLDIDDEVRAYVEAIPEADLIQFEFPDTRSYAAQGLMDPVVEAYLEATWTEEDTARAERAFAAELENWKEDQQHAAHDRIPVTP